MRSCVMETMLNAGKDLAAVLQALEVSESTLHRWRAQYGGMKCEEAKRLKQLVADQALDIQMLGSEIPPQDQAFLFMPPWWPHRIMVKNALTLEDRLWLGTMKGQS